MGEFGNLNLAMNLDEAESAIGRGYHQRNGSTDVKVDMNNDAKQNLKPVPDAPKKENTSDQQHKKHAILIVRHKMHVLCQNHVLWNFIIPVIAHFLVVTYVSLAVLHWYRQNREPSILLYDGLGLLLSITCLTYWCIFYYRFLKPYFSNTRFSQSKQTKVSFLMGCISNGWISRMIYAAPLILFVYVILTDSGNDIKRLRSLGGLFLILVLGYLFSKHPSEVRWDIVSKGLILQIVMAMCTIRWAAGRRFFEDVGNKIEKFLSFSYVGAAFVYSDNLVYKQSVLAFQVLSVIFFVNFLVEVLFYFNVLQRLFRTLGWFLQKAMGTTAVESINCCVSVFLGMTEAMLVIKPYIGDLTKSELQAVLLGQLSTVAGSVFAAYASFGVNPGYLVTASVMSAPAALSFSKLIYPETEKSKTTSQSISKENVYKKKYRGPLSAGCEGALSAVQIVVNIVATLIAFISVIACGNGIVSWFAHLIGYEDVTIVTIVARCLAPLAYLMGIEQAQSYLVGELIATKMILNEFVAYEKLGEMKKLMLLSRRSEAIATYALCSFSNPGSVASSLAMVSTLCPKQLDNATDLAFRAYIGGIVTCFMTACIAGLFIPTGELSHMSQDVLNITMKAVNSTS